MKRKYYIYICYILLTVALMASLYRVKFPTTPEGETTPDNTTATHSVEEECHDEEQVYVCDIAKYKVWADISKIPIHDIWKILYLKNKDEVLLFFQAGLYPDSARLKGNQNQYCYVHFFDKGILYCTIKNGLRSTISADTQDLTFFRSDAVHFATWANYNEIIAHIKQLNGTQTLRLSADPNIPFSALWEPLKNILPLFPLRHRVTLYAQYIPVCSVADTEKPKWDFAEIPTELHTLIAQMTEKANNNALTADDVDALHQARNANKLAFMTILLNKGGEFYDAIFHDKVYRQIPSENTNN